MVLVDVDSNRCALKSCLVITYSWQHKETRLKKDGRLSQRENEFMLQW